MKIAGVQRRSIVHFHALIHHDVPGTDYQPPSDQRRCGRADWGDPPNRAQVRITVEMSDGPGLVSRFGEQVDTQTVNGDPAGEFTAEHAARYIAKYAAKSAEDLGLRERTISLEHCHSST